MKSLAVAILLSVITAKMSVYAFTNTNVVTTTTQLPRFSLEVPNTDKSFLERFEYEMNIRASDISIDVFGYPASAQWSLRFEHGGYNVHDGMTFAGKNVFRRAFTYSAREAFVNGLPLDQWEDFGERIGNAVLGKMARFVGYTIVDSIGNTDEERMDYVSPGPSAPIFEDFSLDEKSKDGSFRQGIRPWRTSPYVYVEKDIGHNAGKPAVILSLRCYSLLEDRNIGTLKMESQAVFPLSSSYYAVFGGSLYPSDIKSRDKSPSASFLLVHSIKKRGHGTLLYAGAYSGPHENQMRFGISLYGSSW